jgi:hypothetical protein
VLDDPNVELPALEWYYPTAKLNEYDLEK